MGIGIEWTTQKVARLKEMLADGYSYSQIGRELGCTRNAVGGKADRLGLNGRVRPKAAPRPRAPKIIRTSGFKRQGPPKPGRVPLAEILATAPVENPCGLIGLTRENCHFPIGDPAKPGFYFCGGIASRGRPFCDFHTSLAYVPIRARQDRRRTPDSI